MNQPRLVKQASIGGIESDPRLSRRPGQFRLTTKEEDEGSELQIFILFVSFVRFVVLLFFFGSASQRDFP